MKQYLGAFEPPDYIVVAFGGSALFNFHTHTSYTGWIYSFCLACVRCNQSDSDKEQR